MEKFEPQVNEYSCGPTALHYFLAIQGYNYAVPPLVKYLNPTPEFGTHPSAIEAFLESEGIDYEVGASPIFPENLPTLVNVNYQNEGDHYLVVTEVDDSNNFTLWDPFSAELVYMSYHDFMNNHYSPLKKLKKWSLHLA